MKKEIVQIAVNQLERIDKYYKKVKYNVSQIYSIGET